MADRISTNNSEANSPARLLIADDHSLIREGLRILLDGEPGLDVIGEAGNGLEAVEQCVSLSPDLVLMDVRMPKMDGLAATRAIKERFPAISVLIVTTHENPDYLLEAIESGAAGYIIKDTSRKELIESIHNVLNGESPLNNKLAVQLLRRLIDNAKSGPKVVSETRVREENLLRSLTHRELEILRLLAPGRTNKAIAEILVLSPGTVKNHVQHIIAKLGVSDRTQAAVLAVGAGLLNPNDSSA